MVTTNDVRQALPANEPAWARDVVQSSAILGLAAHAYVWFRAYMVAGLPSPENWIDRRLFLVPLALGVPILYAAYHRRSWACLILLGATFVGVIGALTWLAGAVTGDDVLTATGPGNAADRTVFFLVPSLVALPLTAACARLGMFSRTGAARSGPLESGSV